ncbi:serine/threonine-protein kinase [Polyangium sp. 15x6]|uniref:serine/threonine-protein kinase n=1 Tax=Polyangium sp. 15x6 TaxID=3042687 RepID=UPI00249C2474|nr:serine/threonine-protein kinase [Polyangium sp. 15x6]MDI3287470.1 serine/threonine-protein kinase [Polyangium sp. 15x6]
MAATAEAAVVDPGAPPRAAGPALRNTVSDDRKHAAALPGMAVLERAPRDEIRELPPSIWERFDDLSLLGRGGMGTVYRGWDKQLARDVALKFVHGHDAARFLREARAQARINHDNVCKIYDVGFADGQPYITMQLVRGEPLSSASREMTLEEKVKVIRESASALHEAHRLGLVHRDVKPQNILVERTEDGLFRPFVMDFGLARIVGERGETLTGQVAGTPAYMAPEQARGEIRSLDRRTDVYSLGATLYDMLAGRPPFVEEHPWKVLMRIATEDAPALRSVCPRVPADLETIVMKCLERDPGQRYESARALGEDLQRYLDGEPVLARKASVGYRLVKLARKHRALVSLVALGLVVAAVLLGFALRARRLAAEEARLAQELGEDVKEMQLFMRYAYSLPLHDVERERAVVRKRLAEIEARISVTGAIGRGAGHYAIGRGHLALQEPEKALGHLKEAQVAGYTSPELEYALGRAMAHVYREEVEGLRRIEDKKERAERKAELDATYKTPALAHLRAATGSRLEHPAYVEGLIALVEGRHEDTLRLAKQAESEAPWFYEAVVLEAETRFAMGSEFRHDAAFDYERMMSHFGPAIEAYRRASAVGTSDPAVHEGACNVFVQILNAAALTRRSVQEPFEEGKKVCEQAVASDPRRGSAHVARAYLHHPWTWAVYYTKTDRVSLWRDQVDMAENAARMANEDPVAHWLVGAAWHVYGIALYHANLDADGAFERSEAGCLESLRLSPTFALPNNDLVRVYIMRAHLAEIRGADTFAFIDRARAAVVRARSKAPDFKPVRQSQWDLNIDEILLRLEHGQDPTSLIASANHDCNDPILPLAKDEKPAHARYCYLMALFDVDFALASGRDPRASLARAAELVEDLHTLELREELFVRAAQAALARGESPEADVTRAIEAILSDSATTGMSRFASMNLGLMQLTLLRWAMIQGTVNARMFEEPLESLAPISGPKHVDPQPFQLAAAVHERRAAWLLGQRKDPSEALAKGFGMIDEAFRRNPRMPRAFATRGDLHLVEARAAKDPKIREEAARRAKESFDAALAGNKFLARETEASRREVDRMLEAEDSSK